MQENNRIHLAEWTSGAWHGGRLPDAISRFCFDARQLLPGDCFIALSGGARDGHAFIEQAAEKGAACAIVERYNDAVAIPQLVVTDTLAAMGAIGGALRSQFSGPVIGITGSCGKTSTKEMLRLLLGVERTHATAGNWNNRIGVPMTLFQLDPIRHDFAVIEAGINQPGEMAALGSMIGADAVILTNIGPAHLELLETTENIAREKAQLVHFANESAPVFLTAKSFRYEALAAFSARAVVLAAEGEAVEPPCARLVRYGLMPGDAGRTRLRLIREGRETQFSIASQSVGICQNAALALVAAEYFRVDLRTLQERIAGWSPTADRGRIAQAGRQTFYIDCYNANPASMADALATYQAAFPTELPRCYVLGAMNELGPRAVELHRAVGARLRLRPQDVAILVGPVALTDAYREGMLSVRDAPKQIRTVVSVKKNESMIADFEGSIFLKGSRSYGLEKLLPESLHTSK